LWDKAFTEQWVHGFAPFFESVIQDRFSPEKGMIIAGGNVSVEWPDSKRVREALQKLEFLMVIDVVRSPDCQYADLILPAATFFGTSIE
jgi:anaerobic selenocysteine-containing dehydrogenase